MADMWKCNTCTFLNDMTSSSCSMCHTRKSSDANQQKNDAIYTHCIEYGLDILITEYESHKLAHTLSDNQPNNANKLVYLFCAQCDKDILTAEYDTHLLAHELTKTSQSESETIPCDLCDVRIPFTEFKHHIASHNNINIINTDTNIAAAEDESHSGPRICHDSGIRCACCNKIKSEDMFWFCNEHIFCNICFEIIQSSQSIINAHSMCSVSGCYQLQRFVILMNKYEQCTDSETCIDMINTSGVFNDFFHLLHKHIDDEAFDCIVSKLRSCDITKCDIFLRNNRDRNKINKQKMDAKEIAHQQILDKMHCYFFHCYDVGNKLTLSERNEINEDLSRKLQQNRERYKSFYAQTRNRSNMKYSELFSEQKESNDNTENNTIYQIGYQFNYGYDGENVSFARDNKEHKYNAVHIIEVSPKYSSMKEELTTNNVSVICIEQYINEYKKAQMHLETAYCKMHHKGIQCENVLSLMIYCNFDHLQYEFSKTYRNDNGRNHTIFYHLGKNLKMAVHKYGDQVREHGCCGKAKQHFYHGVSEKLAFSSYGIEQDHAQHLCKYAGIFIHCPLSTSSSFEVATHFANYKGLLVQFKDNDAKHLSCNGFSVSWLSDFNESEHLFIQNIYKLQIDNILDVKTGKEYSLILKALKNISCFHIRQRSDTLPLEQQITNVIVENQLAHKISTAKYKSFSSLSVYGQSICDTYFNNTKQITVGYLQWGKLLWYHNKQHDYKWINITLLIALFPNVEKMTINSDRFRLKILDDILAYFDNESVKAKIEICIHAQCVSMGQCYVSIYDQIFIEAMGEYTQMFAKRKMYIFHRRESDHSCNIFIHQQIISPLNFSFYLIDNMESIIFVDTTNQTAKRIDQLIKNKICNINNNNKDQLLFNEYSDAKLFIVMDFVKIQSKMANNFNAFKAFFTQETFCLNMELLQSVFPNATYLKILNVSLCEQILDHYCKYISQSHSKLNTIEILDGYTKFIKNAIINTFYQKYPMLVYNFQDGNYGRTVYVRKRGNLSKLPDEYHSRHSILLHH